MPEAGGLGVGIAASLSMAANGIIRGAQGGHAPTQESACISGCAR
jgi:citrate lyase alpha subunit